MIPDSVILRYQYKRGNTMLSFFTILFIILGANAIFMFFSLTGTSSKEPKTDK